MTEFETWGVIFFKVAVFKIGFEVAITLFSAWMSAVAKVKAADGIREIFKDMEKMRDE